jgi:arylsulfatase A-like enzyme/Tfp pilus assembly protein PilF
VKKARSNRIFVLLSAGTLAVAIILVVGKFWPHQSPVRNVLLISIDTCRADHLSCYGFERKTTPGLDALAAEGILFKNAFAPAPMTLPSHSSMMTGVYPPCHGIHENFKNKLARSNRTLAEILKQHGFVTGAVVSAFVLDRQFGLDQGFDSYQDNIKPLGRSADKIERAAGETSRLACDFLEQKKDIPFFLFVHYFDPHAGYDPPEPYASDYKEDLYSGEIAYTDNSINQVVDMLKQLDLYDSTLIVVVGDHGEGLGDHGEETHDYFIYQSTVHVPFVVRHPGKTAARTVTDVVSIVDVAPTILANLSIPIPNEMQGRDVSEYGHTKPIETPERYVYTESVVPLAYNCNALTGLVGPRFKYIESTRPELYDLIADPGETTNLIDRNIKRAKRMQSLLQETIGQLVASQEEKEEVHLDAESIRRLESLGYVATGSSQEGYAIDRSKKDAKDWIEYHSTKKELQHLIADKQYVKARSLCQKLLNHWPESIRERFTMGEIALGLNDFDNAIYHLNLANKLDPNQPGVMYKMGAAYQAKDHFDQAINHYRQALRKWPDHLDTRVNMGAALSELGAFDEAIGHFRSALQINPHAPFARENLALALRSKTDPAAHKRVGQYYYEQGRYARAVTFWNEALRLKPDWPEVQNNLAWLLAAKKEAAYYDPAEALRLAKRACQLTGYKRIGPLDTLSVAYAATGLFNEAITTIQNAIQLAQDADMTTVSEELQARLALYEKETPYQE